MSELSPDQIACLQEGAEEARKRLVDRMRLHILDLHERAIDDLILSASPSKKEGEG